MTLLPAGEARLDILTDGLLLDIGADTYVVSLRALSDLIQHRKREAVVSRRYPGTGGHYLDVEQWISLRRSRTGHALVLISGEGIYSIQLHELQNVVQASGTRTACTISRVVTDARQLDDAHGRQATLEAGA